MYDTNARRHWNYRAIRFEHGEDSFTAIHEVHYENDRPVAYSATPAVVMWSDDEAAQPILDRMREALAKPVLHEADFQHRARRLETFEGAELGQTKLWGVPVRTTGIGTRYVVVADVPERLRGPLWEHLRTLNGRLIVEGVGDACLYEDFRDWCARHALDESAEDSGTHSPEDGSV